MKSSEALNELAGALAKAQQKMQHAAKDSTNPHFKSKYADLASILDACREPLADNGLSFTQAPSKNDGSWVLTTRLMHLSGQWLESECPIISTKPDAQGFGSGMTYARRYSLAAIVGITQDDDDGNAASRPPQVAQQPRKVSEVNQEPASLPKGVKNTAPITQGHAKTLFDVAASKRITVENMKEIMKHYYDVDASKDLQVWQFEELYKLISTNSLEEIGADIVCRLAERDLQKQEFPK